jgi:hypothetical protein
MESTERNNEVTLYEFLVKTTYQTQITHPNDKDCDNPIGYGSGFIVIYKNIPFFITADHVVHVDDYGLENMRTGIDYIVSIYNNVSPEKDKISTVVTPLGGFYYMERINIERLEEKPELIDISLCIMKHSHFQYSFLTDKVCFVDLTVNAGEKKWSIPENLFIEAKEDTNYFIYGKIKPQMKGILLYREDTLKKGLKYIGKSGDYYLLQTEIIVKYEDWAGLSGSPVISETGECIGVLCEVKEGTKLISVMPTEKIKILMDIALIQENMK